jgi:hypothetical protein
VSDVRLTYSIVCVVPQAIGRLWAGAGWVGMAEKPNRTKACGIYGRNRR